GRSVRRRPPGASRSRTLVAVLGRDVLCLPDREADDGQRGIRRGRGGELTTVRNEQIRHVVCPAEPIDDTIAGTFTHPTGSDVVSGRIRWGADRAFRPNSLVNGTALPLRVLAHRQVVGMFVDVHV